MDNSSNSYKGRAQYSSGCLKQSKRQCASKLVLIKASNQSNSKNVGKFSHDLFANTRNAKHDQFTQRFPLNATEEADAMNMKEWPNWALAHPPNITDRESDQKSSCQSELPNTRDTVLESSIVVSTSSAAEHTESTSSQGQFKKSLKNKIDRLDTLRKSQAHKGFSNESIKNS